MAKNDGTIVLEDVRLVFKNFEGKAGAYNREGDRGFSVVIPDEDVAKAMLADGWNIKYLKPNEEEQEKGLEQGPPYLSVKVGYGKGAPPKIILITSRGKTALTEDTVEMLDWADIVHVDLIVRPYHYNVQAKSGIAAYLKSMFVTIEEDALELKYAELDSQ